MSTGAFGWVLLGGAVVLAAGVAVTSCQVYSKASFDLPLGAGYAVRTFHIRTPLRIAGETVRNMGPHPSGAPPPGQDYGYETWLVQGERRVVQVYPDGVRPAAVREDGQFYAYLTAAAQPVLRVVRVRDERTLEFTVPRPAYLFWEGVGLVRLVERDPAGTITFLHEVRVDPRFLGL